jgi:hypothetical protein
MGIAPNPLYPERGYPNYEAKVASGLPGERGPLRFEEGLTTDTDIPNDFARGIQQGQPQQGRMNRNQKVDTKYADETMAQRVHAGSAAWITAPTVLGEFAEGSVDGDNEPTYAQVFNSGARQQRKNATVVDW